MSNAASAQLRAANPARSIFLTANAGAGKTETLINRVARLLLTGAPPEAILCVTYTKAASAEMQRRLFETLGAWAVMEPEPLEAALSDLEEAGRNLARARALFARALETPGGLKIQTIHAFCEKLLRRFPLEAGVSPGFAVLEDAAAAEVSASARELVARLALARPDSDVGKAYAHFSVQLDFRSFDGMFGEFESRRAAIAAYLEGRTDLQRDTDVWRRCGFSRPQNPDAIRDRAVCHALRTAGRQAVDDLLATGRISDRTIGERLASLRQNPDFAILRSVFMTPDGPRVRVGTSAVPAASRTWLGDEQRSVMAACEELQGAVIAEETLHALTIARAYQELYDGAKGSALTFDDLIERTHELLTRRSDAAWVLYKLDGGIEHFLLDEAQDTSPGQWAVLRAITSEFYTGLGGKGGHRTVFAVADEKQSIFSFQGAAPEKLRQEALAFVGAAAATVRLRESRRSRPEILNFVDQVFADPAAAAGLALGATPIPTEHHARRQPGGCVDLWPVTPGDELPEVDPWRPVDDGLAQSAHRKLATQLALHIKATVARREAVGERTKDGEVLRACGFGDFLILVRRRDLVRGRGGLFREILLALKREGVPVGGADRLQLAEHGLFKDFMALARFGLAAADDLSLAGVLRSPFCDVSEDDLFDLAYGREGSLWGTLRRRADERPCWRAAADFGSWFLEAGGSLAPFDLFSRTLSRLDDEGRSMRSRILTRLGTEAQDALEAFLDEAQAAELRGICDLETFTARIEATDLEVKREQALGRGGGAGEVRVMTVHGAKGLEAPIVILPDTTTRATVQGGPLLQTGDGGFLWAPRKSDDCTASAAARSLRERATEHESVRLLYVALTRARDRLIVCGVKTNRPEARNPTTLFERSWYDYVQRAFAGLETRSIAVEGAKGRRFGADPVSAVATSDTAARPTSTPTWLAKAAPSEGPMAAWRSPSKVAEFAGPPAPSPLETVAGLGRYRRGEIIHRLLQVLPEIDPSERRVAAEGLLAREPGLDSEQREEMTVAAMAVLSDERFAAVFGPGSRAEVAIAGRAPGMPSHLAVSGRIDRLLLEKDRVLVVDFKTNRPAPAAIEAADPVYMTQLALYAAVLGEVFPGRRIEAALLWTDGPRLMAAPENMLRQALDDLAGSVDVRPPSPTWR